METMKLAIVLVTLVVLVHALPEKGTWGEFNDVLVLATSQHIFELENNLAKISAQVEALEAKEQPTKEEKDRILVQIGQLDISESKRTNFFLEELKLGDLEPSNKEKYSALFVQFKMLCQDVRELAERVKAIKV